MKKNYSLAASMLLLVACNTTPKYEINGTVSDPALNGQYVYLTNFGDKEMQTVDSAQIVDGKFRFNNELPEQNLCFLSINTKAIAPFGPNSAYSAVVVLDAAPLQAHLDSVFSTVTGSPENDAFVAMKTKVQELQKDFPELLKVYRSEDKDAAKQAVQSPLLETSIEGARGVIINITGGPNLGLHEVNTAAELVQRSVDPEANIIFGAVIDESLDEDIVITVIATGFEKDANSIANNVDSIVDKAWGEKINSIPAPVENTNSSNDLDIPSFLRKNKGIK